LKIFVNCGKTGVVKAPLSNDIVPDPDLVPLLAKRDAGEKLTQQEYGKVGAFIARRARALSKRDLAEENRLLREDLARARAQRDAFKNALKAVLEL